VVIRNALILLLVVSFASWCADANPQPPPSGPGWIQQKRPNGYGPGQWDWTGLTYSWNVIPFYGSPYSGSQTIYSFLNLTGGSAGGSSGNASATYSVSGTSTYKWKWVPRDMNNDGQPDHTLFPADPLYILTKLSGQVQAWPHA
jgi:hypothetical protein